VLQAFVSDRGRQPAPGELEFLVAAQTRKFQASPGIRANGIRQAQSLPGAARGGSELDWVCARGSAGTARTA
jgi:hypothetical protein